MEKIGESFDPKNLNSCTTLGERAHRSYVETGNLLKTIERELGFERFSPKGISQMMEKFVKIREILTIWEKTMEDVDHFVSIYKKREEKR